MSYESEVSDILAKHLTDEHRKDLRYMEGFEDAIDLAGQVASKADAEIKRLREIVDECLVDDEIAEGFGYGALSSELKAKARRTTGRVIRGFGCTSSRCAMSSLTNPNSLV